MMKSKHTHQSQLTRGQRSLAGDRPDCLRVSGPRDKRTSAACVYNRGINTIIQSSFSVSTARIGVDGTTEGARSETDETKRGEAELQPRIHFLSLHLMLHLAQTQNKPILQRSCSQTIWSHGGSGRKVQLPPLACIIIIIIT